MVENLKVHSLKGEFLCLVYLEGQGKQSLGTLEYDRSSRMQSSLCSREEGDLWMEGQGETEAGVGVKEGAGW